MIGWLQGILQKKTANAVLVNVHGVGYTVFASKTVLERLPSEGELVALEIYTQVKEDALQLYGFLDPIEKEVFEVLISMNGIGPRVATSILSAISAQEFARAIGNADEARLCLVSGIGKKKAQRMIVELKDRLQALARAVPLEGEPAIDLSADLRSALLNLGFKNLEVEQTLEVMRPKLREGAELTQLIPEALRILRG